MRFFARFDRRLQGWGVPPPYIIYSPFTILCSLFTQAPFQGNPRRGFSLFFSAFAEKNSPFPALFGRFWGVSPSADGDQRRCLWNPQAFEKA